MQNGISNFIKPKNKLQKQKELIYISPPFKRIIDSLQIISRNKKVYTEY